MGSKGSQKTTETYTPNKQVGKTGTQALDMASNVANQPFQQQVAPVAGFSGDQQQAFQQYRDLQGYAQPYINQASDLYGQSAQAITGDQVNNYLNPYANYVMEGLNDQFGQQRSQATGQLTQAAGGVGADRIGVAQSNLAKQQGNVAGQALSGIYGQALSAAQQDQSRKQGAAAGLGSLGIAGQQAEMSATQGLFGAGQAQQTQSQNEANAPYQWDLARIAHQYQVPQWLSGITAGTAPALGGTKTSEAPAPSPWGTIAGLGLTAAGAFTGNPMMAGAGLKGALGGSAPQTGGMTSAGWGNTGGWNPNVGGGYVYPSARGGAVARKDGGRITPLDVFRSFAMGGGAWNAFADGGGVGLPFDDRFSAVSDDPRIASAMEFGEPLPDSASTLPPPPQLPPQMGPGPQGGGGGMPPQAMGFAPQGGPPQAPPPMPPPAAGGMPPQMPPSSLELAPDPGEGSFARSPGYALMTAGLGTLAASGKRDSRGIPLSPWAALGEGGLKGVEALKVQDTAATQRRRVDLEAKRLLNQAEHQRNTLGETRRYHDIIDRNRQDQLGTAAEVAAERRRHNQEIERRAGDPSQRTPEQQALISATQAKGSPLTAEEITKIVTDIRQGSRPERNPPRPPALAQQAIEAREKELGRKLTTAELTALNAELRNGPTPTGPVGGDRPPSTVLGDDDVSPNFPGATGLGGNITAIGNKVTGALGSEAYPAESKATRILNDLAIRTQSTLQGIAGRPSNYWLGRIGEMTVKPNSWSQGPQEARSRLETTKNSIQSEADRLEREIIPDPKITKTERSKATRSLSELRNLLSDYDAVLGAWSTGDNPLTPAGDAVRDALPGSGDIRGAARDAATGVPKGSTPKRPPGVPPGSQYSRKNNLWKTPEGKIVPGL